MAGITAMGDLSHELESLLIRLGDEAIGFDDRLLEVVQASLDELARMRDYVGAGRPVAPARDLVTRIRLVAKGGAPAAAPPASAPVAAPATATPAAPVAVAPAEFEQEPESELDTETEPEPAASAAAPAIEERAAAAPHSGPPVRDASADRGEVARVDADLLDNMLNVAGEVSIYRARLEQQVSSIDFNLAELGRVVQRLKDQLRKLEIETEAQILHRHVDSGRAARRLRPARARPLFLDPAVLARARGDVLRRREPAGAARNPEPRGAEPADAAGPHRLRAAGRPDAHAHGAVPAPRAAPDAHRPAGGGGDRQESRGPHRRRRRRAGPAGARADARALRAHAAQCRRARHRAAGRAPCGGQGRDRRHRRQPAARGLRGRHRRRGRRRGREPEAGARPRRRARPCDAEAGAVRRAGAAAHPGARVLDRRQGHAVRGPRRRHGRGRHRDQEARRLALHRDRGRQGREVHRAPAVHARHQPGAGRRASATSSIALPLPTVEGVVRVPRSEVQRHLAEEASTFEYGGQKYRFQHLASFVGGAPSPSARARRGGARDPGARRRAFHGARHRRADRQPRDRRQDRRPADRRHPRHLGRDHPWRRAHLHHPGHRRAGALRVAPQPAAEVRAPLARRRRTGASSRWWSTTRSRCAA